MANGIRTGDTRGFNKGRSSKFNKHLKKAGGHISQNVEITIKMKTIVRKTLMIKISQKLSKWLQAYARKTIINEFALN